MNTPTPYRISDNKLSETIVNKASFAVVNCVKSYTFYLSLTFEWMLGDCLNAERADGFPPKNWDKKHGIAGQD